MKDRLGAIKIDSAALMKTKMPKSRKEADHSHGRRKGGKGATAAEGVGAAGAGGDDGSVVAGAGDIAAIMVRLPMRDISFLR